jgi:hypothetical protein
MFWKLSRHYDKAWGSILNSLMDLPASDATLTIADLIPLLLFLSINLGINILFIWQTEQQLTLIRLLICSSVSRWYESKTSTPTLLTRIERSISPISYNLDEM